MGGRGFHRSKAAVGAIGLLSTMLLAGPVTGQASASRGSDAFDDVPAGHWADEAIGWAVDNDITSGVGKGRFDLDGTVTRAQITTFLHRTVSALQGTGGREQIVFSSDRQGDSEIFVMNADGTNVRQLTNDNARDRYASWSPDGTQIAFHSDRDGDFEVFVMDADGANVRQLTSNSHLDTAPAWSPDGTRIAFNSDRTGNFEVFVMDADGTNVRQLTNHTQLDVAPTWSPDGTRIAFNSDRDGDFEVFVMDADGTDVEQITDNTHADYGQVWSPDGTRIAFNSDRTGNFEIYVMDSGGTNVRRLTRDSAANVGPVWSPDGTQLAYTSDGRIFVMDTDGSDGRRLNNDIASAALGPQAWSSNMSRGSDLFDDVPSGHWADEAIGWAVDRGVIAGVDESSFDLDGTVSRAEIVGFLHRAFSRSSDKEFQWRFMNSWSPDGTQIAYEEFVGDDTEIFVLNSDGTNRRQLTNNTATDWRGRWSPDGRRIVFQSDRDGDEEVYVMNSDGTNQTRLTDNNVWDGAGSWSPDGTRIVFESNRQDQTGLTSS